jgi:hypothetical protein
MTFRGVAEELLKDCHIHKHPTAAADKIAAISIMHGFFDGLTEPNFIIQQGRSLQ